MIPGLLTFHHLGLATKAPLRALEFLAALGYSTGDRVRDELQNVDLWFCEHTCSPAVEVISPTGTEGPLDTLLRAQAAVIYHTCYEVQDLARVQAEFEAREIRLTCILPPTPAVLFDGAPVSFYFVRGVGLIELLEVKSRAT